MFFCLGIGTVNGPAVVWKTPAGPDRGSLHRGVAPRAHPIRVRAHHQKAGRLMVLNPYKFQVGKTVFQVQSFEPLTQAQAELAIRFLLKSYKIKKKDAGKTITLVYSGDVATLEQLAALQRGLSGE